jgi:hypothetical protein
MPAAPSLYRGGIAPIRGARELALSLPIPLLLIGEGWARAGFPASTPARPSPWVEVSLNRPKGTYPDAGAKLFPLYVNGVQWERVAVPLLKGETYPIPHRWRGVIGSLGEALQLYQGIVGVGGSLLLPAGADWASAPLTEESLGKLYACDPGSPGKWVGGKSAQFLVELTLLVLARAEAAGY